VHSIIIHNTLNTFGRSQRAKESAIGYSWGWKRRGKPRKRWLDDMEDDLRKIGVKRWRIKAVL
jgi:hypothetical protein